MPARHAPDGPHGRGDAGGVVPPPQGSVEDVLERVRARGGRVTTARRLLLNLVFESPGHHTAEQLAAEVQARAPDIHLSTVYRNLEELERLGVVVHAHLGHGPATYHLATATHSHFVCGSCGATIEAPESLFADLARRADRSFGFRIDPRHFAVLGTCASCRAEAGQDAEPARSGARGRERTGATPHRH